MFQKIEHARSSPTFCAFCQTSEGPFIETGIDLLGHGLILICTRNTERGVGCAEQIGRVGGNMIDRDEHDAKVAQLAGSLDEVRAVADDLDRQLAEQKLAPEALLELVDTRMRETAAKLLKK